MLIDYGMSCALQNFKPPEDEPPFADPARRTKNDIGGLFFERFGLEFEARDRRYDNWVSVKRRPIILEQNAGW